MATQDDLLQAALLYYMQQQGNKAPKFYNVPQSPEQQWQFGQTQGATDFAKNYAQQFIGGQNLNPSGFQFTSDALKGQPFAGGMQLPKFDFSKMTGGAGTGAGTATTPTSVGFQGGPIGGTGSNTSYKPTTPHPLNRDLGNDPNHDIGGYINPRDTSIDPTAPNLLQSVGSWWDKYKASNPNWMNMAWPAIAALVTAQFGPMGTAAAAILKAIVTGRTGGGGGATNPTDAGGPGHGGD